MLPSNKSSASPVADFVIFQEVADKLYWMFSPIMEQQTCRTLGTQAQSSFNPGTFYTFLIITVRQSLSRVSSPVKMATKPGIWQFYLPWAWLNSEELPFPVPSFTIFSGLLLKQEMLYKSSTPFHLQLLSWKETWITKYLGERLSSKAPFILVFTWSI